MMSRFAFAMVAALVGAGSFAAAGSAALAEDVGDAGAGQKIFTQHCKMCHVNTPGARAITAPNLFGLSGRGAGSTSFKGSSALARSGVTWNAKTLDQFLQAPAKMIPGTRMVVKVPDANQRHDLIAYLLSLH